MLGKHALFFVLAVFLVKGDRKSYKNYGVIQALSKNDDDIIKLNSLRKEVEDVDLWNEPNRLHDPVEFSVAPRSKTVVLSKLNKWNISYKVLTENFQEWLDKEREQANKANAPTGRATAGTFGFKLAFDRNYDYDRIVSYLKSVSKVYANNVMLRPIGTTVEKREILSVAVGIFDEESTKRQVIIFECGVHAREWITPTACLYVIQSLLTDQRSLLDEFVFYLIPVLNPDGYVYSWTNDRMWRWNRKKVVQNGLTTYGVDLNRNFDFFFDEHNRTAEQKNDDYRGPYAFSEEESIALRDFIQDFDKKRIFAYFSMHAAASAWLLPYGKKKILIKGQERLLRLGRIATEKIKLKFGTHFRALVVSDFMNVTGTSIDWVTWVTDCLIPFCIEMRRGTEKDEWTPFRFSVNGRAVKDAVMEVWLGVTTVLSEWKSEQA